jgi:hypothetical protein
MSSPSTPPDYAIDQDRLAHVEAMTLSRGSHESIEAGACIMEAVAWVAGERFSDYPRCASPFISAFLRSWNDSLDDAERNALLKPLIPRLVGTRASGVHGLFVERRRGLMAADWLVRIATPTWLRLGGLTTHANALATLPEITSIAQSASIKGVLNAAREDASAAQEAAWSDDWSAACDAAVDAANDAITAGALVAARTAILAAQGATRLHKRHGAPWDAILPGAVTSAHDAAIAVSLTAAQGTKLPETWTLAWAAARDAAGKRLAPIKAELQQSALALVNRMVEAA